jgi:hypothetical protein
MTPTEATNADIRREWRDFGFFYERNDNTREWRLIGSHDGLLGFVDLLQTYCRDPRNAGKFEHEHYGPYLYLKVLTYPDPGINNNAIHGTFEDLKRLARLIEQRLQHATPGDTCAVGKAYAPGCEYELILEIRDADFDPAEADPCLR